MKKLCSFILLLLLGAQYSYAAALPDVTPNEDEVRAVWVTRWQYTSVKDIQNVMQNIKDNNFNTVFFQVRGQGDAFYKSKYEPWSAELTGTLGKDPGFDPLAVAITEAHKRDLKLHAWVNMMPMWKGEAMPDPNAKPTHMLVAHPEWVLKNDKGEPMTLKDGYIFANPLRYDVQEYIITVLADIADRYPIDGIHMDYIRFPSPAWGNDPATKEIYKQVAKKIPSFDEWRRYMLSRFVARVNLSMKYTKYKPQVSAAVIGYYKDIWGWGYENSGSYDKYLQDSKTWVNFSFVDFITPMIYWTIGDKPEFETLVKDFTSTLPAKKVVIGMSTTDFSAEETWNQIQISRKYGAKGFSLFSYSSNFKFWEAFKNAISKW